MISFDKLPGSIANQVYAKGVYEAEIVKAEMKTPKLKEDGQRPDYLNLQYKLSDAQTGKPVGTYFDIFTESPNQYVMFKLRKFMEALSLELPEFELKDLTKLVVGRKLLVNLTTNKNNLGNEQNTINLFDEFPPYAPLALDVSAEDDGTLPFTMGNESQPTVNADENY